MFLAMQEIRFSKWRYALVGGIILLVAYMVFMLSGLASGLQTGHTKAIRDWHADSVVLAQDANGVFGASQMTQGDLQRVSAGSKSAIGLYQGSASLANASGDKHNVSVIGSAAGSFTTPSVIRGSNYSKKYQVTISQNLADDGFGIGDRITVGSLNHALTVTGIVPATTYSIVPVIYTSLDTWTELKYGGQPFSSESGKPINAIVVRGAIRSLSNPTGKTKLQNLDMNTFIDNIPGVSAEQLTFKGMIGLLIVITAAIVGMFMYVVTLQKMPVFGVMKAQGIPTRFMARSIVAQAFIIGLASIVVAFMLAWLSSLALPSAMPFTADTGQWCVYGVALLLVTVLGGVFSVRTVSKVDPITAMGEE
ncbi:MAG: ABC transporter permease [Bifidobacterium aquikefiri]|uniref:Efflux ABC transporter permease n=2 Tax=Bifidobacterium aquikefiri TaxID=1653207 RepID=A0A261G131_9BIFI|nr:efflux ABC transporter permease [Bifidobacterium aquikefiri]